MTDKEIPTVLKSIDLIMENPSGSKRVFLTVTVAGTDYEHYVDCPLGMKETPEEYVTANLAKISADMGQDSSKSDGMETRDYKHPKGVLAIKQIEAASTIKDKVDLIIEMLKKQM